MRSATGGGQRRRVANADGVEPFMTAGMRGPQATIGQFLDLWDRDRGEAAHWHNGLLSQQLPRLRRHVCHAEDLEDVGQEVSMVIARDEAQALRRSQAAASMPGWNWRALLLVARRWRVADARLRAAEDVYTRLRDHGEPSQATRGPQMSRADLDRYVAAGTSRQREVLGRFLAGETLRGIGRELRLAPATVHEHFDVGLQGVRQRFWLDLSDANLVVSVELGR